MSRDWTNTEVDLLQDLWRKGYTMPDIATIMGRTLASIHHKKRKMGLRGTNRETKGEYTHSKPRNTSQRKMRKCISRLSPSCYGEFMSEHSGHRICRRCRDTMAKMGTSFKFLEPHDVRTQ